MLINTFNDYFINSSQANCILDANIINNLSRNTLQGVSKFEFTLGLMKIWFIRHCEVLNPIP